MKIVLNDEVTLSWDFCGSDPTPPQRSSRAVIAADDDRPEELRRRELSRHSDLADVQEFIDLLSSTWLSQSENRRSLPLENGDDVLKNALFGRYVIRELVGEGGFGFVFRADDLQLKRSVALKLPRPDILVSPALRARFIREAQAAASLDHPNIITIHEAVEIGSIVYIASEFCSGPTLAAWSKEHGGRGGWRSTARIMGLLARAVHHAHQRGILHRDLKPANVLLKPIANCEGAELVPLLTDFGLAKQLAEAEDITRTAKRIGTTRYMSPEQLFGDPRDVTTSADIYGLGVILYELLAGRRPFDAEEDHEVARMVREAEPPRIRILRRDVPRDLETICLKCLEKAPQRRYASAEELADDLQRCLDGREIRARPLGRGQRLLRSCRRRPLATALAAALVISLASGVGGVVWQGRKAFYHAEQVERSLIEAELGLVNWAWIRDESLRSPNLNTPISIAARQRLRDHYTRLLALHSASRPSLAFQAAANSYRARVAELDNDLDLAGECYSKSIEQWRTLVAVDPEDLRYARALAENLYAHGLLLRSRGVTDNLVGRTDGAEAHFKRLLAEDGDAGRVCAEYARLLGERAEALDQLRLADYANILTSASRDLWKRLSVSFPHVREYQFQYAQAAFFYHIRVERRNLALRKPKRLEIPEQMARQLVETEPANDKYRLLHVQIVRYMGSAARDNKLWSEAARLYEIARVALRQMMQRGSRDSTVGNLLASTACNAAHCYRQAGNEDAATKATEEAIEASLLCRERNSLSRENAAIFGFLYKDLGQAYQARGQWAEARQAYNDACRILREHSGSIVEARRGEKAITDCKLALSELDNKIRESARPPGNLP